MSSLRFSLIFLATLTTLPSFAKLKVVTTTSTLAELARQIGGDEISVYSLTSYIQDPHYIEPKPTYMVKLRKADLLVSVGLDLEIGWIGVISRGSKNPSLLSGNKGRFEAGKFIEALDIPGKIDRAQGDVHPSGNPHFHLDPIRVKKVVKALASTLGDLVPSKRFLFNQRLEKFNKKIDQKMLNWKDRIVRSGVSRVITFHQSFNYFLSRFGISLLNTVEQKPGVPPNASYTGKLIKVIKQKSVRCILVSTYHEGAAAIKKIEGETSIKSHNLLIEVKEDYFSLIENIVLVIESCGEKLAIQKKGLSTVLL